MVGRVTVEGVTLGLRDDLQWVIMRQPEEPNQAEWLLSIARKIYTPVKAPMKFQLTAEEAVRAFARDNGGVADLAKQHGDDFGVIV